ncbi:pyruvate, phosphate dikinase [Alloprevotella tannerae]|jgi:pyruvate, phosphate dikinase|uniref:pyruvate, phosphate dikinase n=1 Tax=Alloprevotella tannerae TaxID=76122 RepID=UPI001CB4E265|nr:pyruvate, phosphate dikinase [Alloprevotella tannerae]MBF0953013.1 pyruvate, phosphate dikinase [Alloprevotella tannerae]MBF0961085.1 pyruvate, phosphate dikinase [Alloprevotella tannerae]
MDNQKRVFTFGNGHAEGRADMRNLLGGKGANLAEMNLIGIPVPPGFTITTEVCNEYYEIGREKVIELLSDEINKSLHLIEENTGMKFGDPEKPLLLSVRSGARASMPGMMDTILNLGLNDQVVEGLARKTNNPRFAYDAYRRFVQMYGDVVLELKPASKEEIDPFEAIIDQVKKEKGVKLDNELETEDLKRLVTLFKAAIIEHTGKRFPDDPMEQLWGAICAVFGSWMNERAILYRKMEGIPQEWGTAVTVMAMVFGNMGANSATGVCFSRDAATGEDIFNGEWLVNAQGEDVVAGIRTPQQITLEGSRRWAELQGITEEERREKFPSMEEAMPEIYKELDALQTKLENHYRDMQDMEFTVQEGKLWFLQTRNGKRTGAAMVKIAMDLLQQGMIDEKTAIKRCEPLKLDELLHPVFNKKSLQEAKELTRGLPASPGAACGQIVFFADEAVKWHKDGHKVILVRIETSPEDLAGMAEAEGILTARGGMTSHAAVVARGMGKCCVSGAGAINVDYKKRIVEIDGLILKEGDYISLNGTNGSVYKGKIATQAAELSGDFAALMDLCAKYTRLKVRTNADTPQDAEVARRFGAVGIGLCRTEHMFFDNEKIVAMREMILADDIEGRRKALNKLLPYQKEDFKAIFKTMDGYPVNVRLLDPPLHEFVPHDKKGQAIMAEEMGVTPEYIKQRVDSLYEHNPMLGLRGCRLGNTYPEITQMQTRAILTAACELKKEGFDPHPEIMVPLIGILYEFEAQEKVIRQEAAAIFAEQGVEVEFKIGTMIEIPRAALTSNRIATRAEYFSFGTNDLTQMTFGYSRDDIATFLPIYLEKKILKVDPFQVLDRAGVGQLIQMSVEKGRSVRPSLKCGICGEHGGEPSSVHFCHEVGLDYVSCSPFRVPIARLAAAQAAVEE